MIIAIFYQFYRFSCLDLDKKFHFANVIIIFKSIPIISDRYKKNTTFLMYLLTCRKLRITKAVFYELESTLLLKT